MISAVCRLGARIHAKNRGACCDLGCKPIRLCWIAQYLCVDSLTFARYLRTICAGADLPPRLAPGDLFSLEWKHEFIVCFFVIILRNCRAKKFGRPLRAAHGCFQLWVFGGGRSEFKVQRHLNLPGTSDGVRDDTQAAGAAKEATAHGSYACCIAGSGQHRRWSAGGCVIGRK